MSQLLLRPVIELTTSLTGKNMRRHLHLNGMIVTIDEYFPVRGLLVVGILAVALRLLAPLVMWLPRDDACHGAYQHIPTSWVYEKIESTMATIGSPGITRP